MVGTWSGKQTHGFLWLVQLTGVDLLLVVHVYLQEPDEHAEEDPKEL